ncbi:MAG: sialidase family protein [Thermoplasmata archaeon]
MRLQHALVERKARIGGSCFRTLHRQRMSRTTAIGVVSAVIVLLIMASVLTSLDRRGSVATTNSAGEIFTDPVLVNDNRSNTQARPSLAIAPSGELYVVWEDARSGKYDIFFSKSSDNGLTFGKNVKVDSAPSPTVQIDPCMALSDSGSVFVAWQDNRRNSLDYDVYMAFSTDGGNTFGRNVKVDDSTDTISWQERPSIAVAHDGTILVAWDDDRTGQIRVRASYSADGGASFAPSYEIAPPSRPSVAQTCAVLAYDDNAFFAVFLDNSTGISHPYVAVSTDSGRTFGTPVRLDSSGTPGSPQRAVSVAPLHGGGAVAVWEDYRNGNWDAMCARISSTGERSGTDFRVDDDSSTADQRNPRVATDVLDNIYAAWEDERESKFTIRFSYCKRVESAFAASVEVNRPSDNMQRHPALCAGNQGYVFVAWQDDASGSYDVYASMGHVQDLDTPIPEFSAAVLPAGAVALIVVVLRRRRPSRSG